MDLHPLLVRQLRRLGIEHQQTPPDAASWSLLLRRVSRAYEEHDMEGYLLDRSQNLASQEMTALHATLRAERDLLETRVVARTEELRLSEVRLASLLSLSADWIWEQDAELKFTYISDSVEAAAGFSPSLLLGRRRLSNDASVAPADSEAAYEACVEGRKAFRDFTYALTRPDGVVRHIRISGEPVFDEGGNFQATVASAAT